MKQIISGLIILVALASAFFYVFPEYERVMSLNKEKSDIIDAIDKGHQIGSLSQSLKDLIKSIPEEKKNALNKIASSSIDQLAIANDLRIMAVRHSIVIDSLKVDQKDAPSGVLNNTSPTYRTLTADMSLTAPYQDFLAFLSDMERSLQIFDVSKLTIKPAAVEPYGYSLTVDTYWVPSQ